MIGKHKRLAAIRSIIDSDAGSTQEDIKARLENLGITASQSTMSRDLREMGVVKVPVEGGRSMYRLNNTVNIQYSGIGQAMAEFSLVYEEIGNLMVIKTKPGNARDLCLVLDRQNWKEIVGTIAGDDTILVIAKTLSDMRVITERLEQSTGKVIQ